MKRIVDTAANNSFVEESVKIGRGSNVAPTVLYRRKLDVGMNSYIDDHCYFTCNICVGNFVHISPFVYVVGGDGTVTFEDYSGVSAGCRILCTSDNFLFGGLQHPAIPEALREGSPICGDVIIGKGCMLGIGTIVFPDVVIPNGVTTGVNTVIRPGMSLKPWHYYDASGRCVPRRNIESARQLCEG